MLWIGRFTLVSVGPLLSADCFGLVSVDWLLWVGHCGSVAVVAVDRFLGSVAVYWLPSVDRRGLVVVDWLPLVGRCGLVAFCRLLWVGRGRSVARVSYFMLGNVVGSFGLVVVSRLLWGGRCGCHCRLCWLLAF